MKVGWLVGWLVNWLVEIEAPQHRKKNTKVVASYQTPLVDLTTWFQQRVERAHYSGQELRKLEENTSASS